MHDQHISTHSGQGQGSAALIAIVRLLARSAARVTTVVGARNSGDGAANLNQLKAATAVTRSAAC